MSYDPIVLPSDMPENVSFALQQIQARLVEYSSTETISGTVTLRPNETTTVVQSPGIQQGMHAWTYPASASASDEQTYIAPADVVDGQLTINHASTGEVDKLVYWFVT